MRRITIIIAKEKLILLLCMLLSVGCSTLPKALDKIDEKQICTDEKEIYIISHGWHVGLAIKASDLNALMPDLPERFPQSTYYEIGWGDTGFYQSKQITTGLTLRAMFWSAGSVLHIVGLDKNPKDQFSSSEIKVLTSDTKNYQNILRFIKSSFKYDAIGHVIKENKGIYGDSQFYTANGRYHILNTCNKWSAKALYSGGYDIFPGFKLTSSSVMNSLDKACPQ